MGSTVEKKDLLERLTEGFEASGYSGKPERQKAIDALRGRGLPHSKSEEYRFTPVVRALEATFEPASPVKPEIRGSLRLIKDTLGSQIVFVNGRLAPEQTRLEKGLTLTFAPLPALQPGQDPFDILNLAFAENLVTLNVDNGIELRDPLSIVHYIDNAGFVFANPRWTINVGETASVTVLEYTVFAGATPYFNNKQSTINAGKGARIEFITIQQGGREEVMVNNAQVRLADAAHALCYTCTLEGRLIRNNLTMTLEGEQIDAHLNGLYLVSGNSLVDNHTVVDHQKPNSFSNELYKGVMDENGKAVFNGKIFVRQDAQKTNAFQSNRNILLSETSNIHTKPQLEIWADDVKCSHGCTTGQLDEEALFYLRSRGISKDIARGLLLTAFGSETLEGIRHESIRGYVESLILKKLHPAEAS